MGQGQHSLKGWFGVGFHATSLTDLRQTAVARAYYNRFHDLEITHDQGEEIDPTSGASQAEGMSYGDYDVRVKGTLEGSTEGCFPALARSLMGGAMGDSTVGTTGKQHVMVLADTVPLAGGRLSYERRFGTNAESEIGNGICNKLGYKVDQAGYVRIPFEMLGSTPSYLGTPSTPTLPDVSTLMAQRPSTLTFDGDATQAVKGFSWMLERKMDDKDYDISSRQRRDASYQELVPTFEAEITFQTMANCRRFWGSATATSPTDTETYYPVNLKNERADVIAGGTAKHTVTLDLPRCHVKVGTPMKGKDVIRQKVTGQAFYKAASGHGAQLTIINSVASY
ncbi:MAG: hypothetical protein ABR562_03725 [Thermoplasmatota archaeon]